MPRMEVLDLFTYSQRQFQSLASNAVIIQKTLVNWEMVYKEAAVSKFELKF
jgi:hypothetical protein